MLSSQARRCRIEMIDNVAKGFGDVVCDVTNMAATVSVPFMFCLVLSIGLGLS